MLDIKHYLVDLSGQPCNVPKILHLAAAAMNGDRNKISIKDVAWAKEHYEKLQYDIDKLLDMKMMPEARKPQTGILVSNMIYDAAYFHAFLCAMGRINEKFPYDEFADIIVPKKQNPDGIGKVRLLK